MSVKTTLTTPALLKILPSVQMKFYYWLAITKNSKRDQPSGKNLIGPFLPCSECALFDGQLNCPRPALGKIEVFESPVLTTPSLKARPAMWCPQGDPGTLSEKSAELQRSNSKDSAMFLLCTMTPSWMTLPLWEICLSKKLGRISGALRNIMLTNIQGQDTGRAPSTSPPSFRQAALSQMNQISEGLHWGVSIR